MGAVCDAFDPVTREGVILVVEPPPPGDDAARRAELADFLRKRRAALQPEEVGLPSSGGRRRTPGLRREEVALVAGVGTTWYTWLEQGRDVRASVDVLEAIARALRLSDAEREHLMLLGRGDAAPAIPAPEAASPALRRMVEGLDPHPAYVIGRAHDYLCWNRSMATTFGDPLDWPEGERNAVWLAFMDPARRAMLVDYEPSARRLLARFRGDLAANVGDPRFEQLIAALREGSPQFRKWWSAHEVRGSGEGTKLMNHPSGQRLVFEHATFRHAVNPEQRLVLYTPDDESRAWIEARLAAERASSSARRRARGSVPRGRRSAA
jgi:transcriptional regulator with XRE-family HTH domain